MKIKVSVTDKGHTSVIVDGVRSINFRADSQIWQTPSETS